MAFARIRNIDSDVERTGRQRAVIEAMIDRVKDASPVQLMKMAGELARLVETNISVTDAVDYATIVLGYRNG